MKNQIIQTNQMWMTVQESRVPSYLPNSYLLLLSALDNGWQVSKAELLPSWDQHGFVYLVTLYHHNQNHSQMLILPKNQLVESLLDENLKEPSSQRRMVQLV